MIVDGIQVGCLVEVYTLWVLSCFTFTVYYVVWIVLLL